MTMQPMLDHEPTLLLIFSPKLGYGLARRKWLAQLDEIRKLPETEGRSR
jgi:hypothetical protein